MYINIWRAPCTVSAVNVVQEKCTKVDRQLYRYLSFPFISCLHVYTPACYICINLQLLRVLAGCQFKRKHFFFCIISCILPCRLFIFFDTLRQHWRRTWHPSLPATAVHLYVHSKISIPSFALAEKPSKIPAWQLFRIVDAITGAESCQCHRWTIIVCHTIKQLFLSTFRLNGWSIHIILFAEFPVRSVTKCDAEWKTLQALIYWTLSFRIIFSLD